MNDSRIVFLLNGFESIHVNEYPEFIATRNTRTV